MDELVECLLAATYGKSDEINSMDTLKVLKDYATGAALEVRRAIKEKGEMEAKIKAQETEIHQLTDLVTRYSITYESMLKELDQVKRENAALRVASVSHR